MKPGKTSILLNLRGTGSHKARLEVFGQGNRCLEVQTRQIGKKTVPIVTSYIHLGCAVEKDLTFLNESFRRGALAATSFDALRAMVFQNTAIPLDVRGQLLSVFVDSTYFNLEVWTGPEDKGWSRLLQGHLRLMRRTLAKDFTAEQLFQFSQAETSMYLPHPPLGTPETPGKFPGSTGSPVQRIIDSLSGRIREWLQDSQSYLDLPALLEKVATLVTLFPLFPSEFAEALRQVTENVYGRGTPHVD